MNEHHQHSPVHPDAKPVVLNLGAPEAERQIVGVTPVTAVTWEFGRSVLTLPENLAGLRILDVGGGASDMTARLLEEGADVFAIDPRYKSRADLKGRALNQLRHHSHGKQQDRRVQETVDRCIESMKDNPQRYIATLATDLPFEDGHFDIVYSQATIFGYLDVDYNLLLKAVTEALRVTRTGGSVQLVPFNAEHNSGNGPQADALRRENHPKLLRWLDGNKSFQYKVENTGVLDFRRLAIIKGHN